MLSYGETERRRIGKREREFLFKQQNGKCNYCGRKLGAHYLQVDHKTPVSLDGSDRMSNLQLLCGPCNTRKGDLTNVEFRRKYKLTPARKAKGPPNKVIPQKHFDAITKQTADRRRRRRDAEVW